MTKAAFPFADFSKMMTEMKMPNVDFTSIMAIQQKNFEAVTAANQLAMDGFRAVFERQVTIAQQAVEEAQTAVKGLSEGGAKVDVEAQSELAKAAMEKAVANVRELTEMVTKSQGEVVDVLQKRMLDGIEEVKGQMKVN